MKLVVDSNILFTFFWKDSIFNELSDTLELYSPEFALEEINKYSGHIIRKTKISKKEFDNIKLELVSKIVFVPLKEYIYLIKKIKNLIKNFSENEKEEILKDIDFIALSSKLNMPLWSNDKLLKKQKIVNVLSTEEIIKLKS